MKQACHGIATYKIDGRTSVRVGYPDGHIEVDVGLPFPLSVIQSIATRTLSPKAVLRSLPAIQHALAAARAQKR